MLADVFTDFDQGTATLATGAGLQFVPMFHAWQFRREEITAGAFVLAWRNRRFLLLPFSQL